MNNRSLPVLAAAGLFLLASLCPFPAYFSARAKEEIPVSRAECVLEASSRRILFGKDENLPLPMASTTKILTAILILDDLGLKEEVEIPKEAEGVEGSSAYLKAGDVYTVEDLLYGLMLRSGNDCAVTLALYHSGSIEAFAQKMNEKAAFLGAQDSHFCNPHGLPAAGHHTTARDLALITAYAMQNSDFVKIVSSKYYEPRHYQNKNKMLSGFEGATGVKTGYTLQAGRCLVTSAARGGMTLVCVVLNSPKMYERSAQLLEDAFSKYTLAELVKEGQTFGGCLARHGFCYPLSKGEREKVRIFVKTSDPLPQRRGEFAGILSITLENSLIFSENLFIM